MIRDAHKNLLHNGVRETINEIRCKYWIRRIRRKVKNINCCVTCKNFGGQPYFYSESPASPECRIVPSHCFSNIGIDYAGPVFTEEWFSVKVKWWNVQSLGCFNHLLYFKSNLFRYC